MIKKALTSLEATINYQKSQLLSRDQATLLTTQSAHAPRVYYCVLSMYQFKSLFGDDDEGDDNDKNDDNGEDDDDK